MKTLIQGKKIIKSFGDGLEKVQILKDVDIQIEEGQFVAIMGPSGSGKSTLMYALSGMDTIDSGEVIFDDQVINQMNEVELADLRRQKMGFIFQQPTFLKNLSIIDNIILPNLKEKASSMDDLAKRAEDLMSKVGIGELKDRKINQVSGGQLQRAGICRALMGQPRVIFGDEPTGALNSKAAQEILTILSKINAEGTTIIIVTHDAKVAAQSERVLFVGDGQLIDELYLGKFNNQALERRMELVTQTVVKTEI
ncbi:ABC transporter ATP-binding protein [Enterococcus sp. AZ109]|uniref:ABC transporter ATP-binding protein n=1 Tax=Enterococcus sp. AZ109 TaxID=2774634 RepID=UPI003F224E8A